MFSSVVEFETPESFFLPILSDLSPTLLILPLFP